MQVYLPCELMPNSRFGPSGTCDPPGSPRTRKYWDIQIQVQFSYLSMSKSHLKGSSMLRDSGQEQGVSEQPFRELFALGEAT